jgi:hypothetical protein
MAKSKAKGVEALKELLLQVVGIQDDLAFRMFQQDEPTATIEAFQASDQRGRYLAYARTAITHLMPGER